MITGIAALHYGVSDVAESTRYFEDFGLPLVERRDDLGRFELPDGSAIHIRHREDGALPEGRVRGDGVREVIWAVDSQAALDALSRRLAAVVDISTDAAGVVHFVPPFGIPMALALFHPRPVRSAPDPLNSPGRVNRLNQHRKWRERALPKVINHVVWALPDFQQAHEFLTEVLDFRLTDLQRDFGVYLRADGSNNHHSVLLVNANAPFPGMDGEVRFHHANFGVEDIDEMMVGANHMVRQGWEPSHMSAGGARVATCVADVSDMAAVERVAAAAIEAFGGFDSWVNNAGAGTYGTLEQVPVDDHRRVFDVNYFGTLHGSLVAARHLRGRGGAIVNVGSILGDRAILQQGPYCATKHAVQALTDTLRMELEREGADISVTLVKPGAIDTPFPEHARTFMDAPPRLPPPLYVPEIVADAVLFACAHPKRTLYAGGGGLLSSLLSQAAPRLADLAMEVVGTTVQQKPGDAGDPGRRDNLYEPRVDALRGSRRVHARRSSMALQLQKLPGSLVGLGAAGISAMVLTAWAVARRRPST